MKKGTSLSKNKKIMRKLIVSCFVVGIVFNANAQNYWKKNAGKTAKVILTNSKANEKMADKGIVKFEPFGQPKETEACIFVAPKFKYQKLIGIGELLQMLQPKLFTKCPRINKKKFWMLIMGKTVWATLLFVPI